MKAKLLPMLVVFIAITALIVSAISVDATNEKTSEGVQIRGLICEVGQSGPIPAVDVVVTLTYNEKQFTGETDENGYFQIKISDESTIDTTKKVQFDFKFDGYSIFALPDTMSLVENSFKNSLDPSINSVAEIDLSTLTPEKGIYTITNDVQHCILLGNTYVTGSITVVNSVTGSVVRNAEIVLKNGDNTYIAYTNSEGICTIDSIRIGTYSITIKCDGFNTYEGSVEISKSSLKMSFELNQKEPTTYFGMTLYHLMLIFGVSVGLCLVIISYVLCTRTWKNVDRADAGVK